MKKDKTKKAVTGNADTMSGTDAVSTDDAGVKRKKGGFLRRIRWYIWVLAVLVIGYAGVSVYFMDHFFLGTTVNGVDMELATVEEVDALVLSQASTYTLTLNERDGGVEVLTPEELGMTFTAPEDAAEYKRSQNGFLWPRMFFQSDSYTIGPEITIDEDTFEAAVASLACVTDGVEPEDAYVEMTSTGYEVYAEVEGSLVDEEALKDLIYEAAAGLATSVDLEEAGVYESPEITTQSEEVVSLAETLDTWLGTEVTYEFGSTSTVVIDGSTIIDYISLDGYEAVLDEEAVAAWVAALADEKDTLKKSRSFNSTLRGTITVSGGNYGWKIDQETESADLIASIKAGEVVTKEPAYSSEALTWDGPNGDIGSTYIEVDLSAQKMWAYVNGSLLIETDVVTGNITKGNGTVAVVASVQYKQRNATLTGDDYSSFVYFWMPFYGNYGIHDATWRSEFGGEIYLTNGSHGCVNTPYEAMQVIFNNISTGTPVITYY